MLKRFIKFKANIEEFVREGSALAREVAELMPSAMESLDIEILLKQLTQMHSVSMQLQMANGKVHLHQVLFLFDVLIQDFGDDFQHYLAPDAEIVNNPHFENGIVKSLNGNVSELTDEEKEAVKCLKKVDNEVNLSLSNDDDIDESEDCNYAINILRNANRQQQRMESVVQYIDFTRIPITSNIVERFFSQVKLNMTAMRNRMYPHTLENLMFIKMNHLMVNPMVVQQAMTLIKNSQQS